VLYFLHVNETAYASQIADRLGLAQSAVQKQLVRLEDAGVLVSALRANVRFFTWNPRYPFRKQLRALLDRGLDFVEPNQREMYSAATMRKRPRRPGKP
jgi:DNA-binding transcriptional ArsR family regulator